MAHASFRSAKEAKRIAEGDGIRVEIVIVADRPNLETKLYLETVIADATQVVEVDFGDLGMARNAGVLAAEGDFIAFLDGDDLWGDTWLAAAHAAAKADTAPIVWHPEASLFFGDQIDSYWLRHYDQGSSEADWLLLGHRNLWTALSFASASVYREMPYRRNAIDAGFGYEDWAWNCDTIMLGWKHRIVPGTAHLIRMSADSLVRRTAAGKALPTPTDLFRRQLWPRCGTPKAFP